ncbi:hypothetical protein ACWC09_43715 [Streptomyces sp. NPDC001617]
MPDLSHHARRLREVADALEAQSHPNDPVSPHPDTMEIIGNRHTKRGQLNYAVPDVLQLQRRIRRCNADHDVPHGDIAALAFDAWLRANGYPPDLKPPERDAFVSGRPDRLSMDGTPQNLVARRAPRNSCRFLGQPTS